ncbi:MAG: hypothetical protein N3A72_06140 [bacterium]|nr:hypothetical protein [bacterium]
MIFTNDLPRKATGYWQLLLAIGVWSALFWAMVYCSRLIPNPEETVLFFWAEDYLTFLSAMILIASTLYLIDVYVRYSLSIASLFGLTLVCTVINHYVNQIEPATVTTSFIVNLAILGIACNLGKLIGLFVAERSYIVPLALVAAVADVWSVFAGPTARIIETPLYYHRFIIHYPTFGSEFLTPMLGLGDFAFLSLFLTLIPRFNLRVRATGWGLILSFVIAILLSILSGKGIPVIPFMAAAFLWVNWKLLEFKPNDIRTTFIFIGLFLLIVIGFTYITKPRIKNILPPTPPNVTQRLPVLPNSIDTSLQSNK